MRKYVMTTIAVLPLLLGASRAAQSWSPEVPTTVWGFSSEDAGTGAYLGVDIADVNADRVQVLKLKDEAGVEVTMVDQDAPAGKAGIKEHDVILTMNGTEIESKAQIQRLIRETPPGRLVTLGLSRDGQPVTIKLQLADRRKEFAYIAPKSKEYHYEIPPLPSIPNVSDFEMPSFVVVHSSARSGVMVENITPQLGEFFGAKNGKGVLVRSVEKGSRGEKAGLRAGDLIVKVGDQSVQDTGDFTHALRSHTGSTIGLVVIRDKKEQTLTLTLPPRNESGEIIEESFDADELNAATRAEVLAVTNQLAQVQPQLNLATDDMRKAAKSRCRAALDQQKQMRDQAEQMREQLQPQVQQNLQIRQRQLQNEIQQMRRVIPENGLDI